MLPLLRREARRTGCELAFESSSVVAADRPLVPLEDFAIQPRPYQVEAIDALHRRVQGVLVLPCGGGKTTVAVLAALSLSQATLIVVHTRDLVSQWVSTIERAVGGGTAGGYPVRVIGAGRGVDASPLRPGEVCVAMVQALPDALNVVRSAAVVVVDEAHHAPAQQWAWLLSFAPARWRWGLTATPDRSYGWGFLLGDLFGPVIYERSTIELISDGYLRRPLVVPVRVRWAPSEDAYWVDVRCPDCGRVTSTTERSLRDGSATCRARRKCGIQLTPEMERRRGKLRWSAALTEWATSEEARSVVQALGVAGWKDGRRNLTLVPRKRAARDIAVGLNEAGVYADAITSDVKARDELIEHLRVGELDALVGTQLADEGLDIAEVDLLVMGSCGRSAGITQQRGGRICRPAGHERPVIFDIVPDGLAYQWRDRLRAYIDAYGSEAIASFKPVDLKDALNFL